MATDARIPGEISLALQKFQLSFDAIGKIRSKGEALEAIERFMSSVTTMARTFRNYPAEKPELKEAAVAVAALGGPCIKLADAVLAEKVEDAESAKNKEEAVNALQKAMEACGPAIGKAISVLVTYPGSN